MKHVKIFSEFFGRKVNANGEKQTLSDFSKEIKALSSEERDDLATLAAVELGTTYEPPEAK